jgi:hypothetical protein
MKTKHLTTISLSVLLCIMIGCVQPKPYRHHPDLWARSEFIKSLVLAPPDIDMYEITIGEGSFVEQAKKVSRGSRVAREDWRSQAELNVKRGILQAFREKGVTAETLNVQDPEMMEELLDIQALYRTVNTSIRLHTYTDKSIEEELGSIKALFMDSRIEVPSDLFKPFEFPDKKSHFDYSVGPVRKVLKKGAGKALILVNGFDEVSTSERRTLIAAGIVLNKVLSSKSPVGIPGLPEAGRTSASVAIIDESGDVLWYCVDGSFMDDLVNPENAVRLVKRIVSEVPQGVVNR